ncbi:glycoside hydrolase family protein [Actinacidiphila epipremni]|uniref:Beta-xylosidase n=1 Tax=Actinacidiphila epipremni TaxID=2053013 RepID=A0ABX0ZU07_9ACTN|nr:beta-xylosidase [Actinacidiphila epipremni]NJP46457.1 beta-xylosidase [Actinacidiphila epipremni]
MNHRPLRRLRARAMAGLAVAALAGSWLVSAPARAGAADTSVSIDLSRPGAAPSHAGSGFLYGLSQDGSGPADSLLQPLAPTLFRGGGARLAGGGWLGDGYRAGSGYQARIDSALSQARRVTGAPYHATYHLLVSDLWGADTTQPADTVYPCDNGDCSNWAAFVDRVVGDVRASGVSVAYDIWNEPDGTGFWQRGVNSAQYYRMWDTAVREIRRLQPSAVVVGPSYSGYNHGWLDGFLGQTKADGTLPDVVNWHFGADPAADNADAGALMAAHGVPARPTTINEYLFSQQQNAGYTAWFLDRLAVSGVSQAAHAIWSDCCTSPSLDSLLTAGGQPTGQWWTYRAYARMSGATVASTSSGAIAVAGSRDQAAATAYALLGSNSGQSGATTLNVTGLAATPWLVGANGKVHVLVQRIPDVAPLDAPLTVQDADVAVSAGSTLSVPVSYVSGTDAYAVTLTPGNGSGSGGTTTVVDGTVTGGGADYFTYGANWGVTTGVPDMYAGTANWSYVAGATAGFHFQGSRVALHAVRDVDQGIFSVSVDGGPAVAVDGYAPARNASGVVWTSPVLSPGAHTLTLVNTGQRNGASSGNNVAIDRADVTAP